MKKRISATIIMLAVLVNMLIPAISAQAALGINHETEVSLMAALGIVPGYPDKYDAKAPVKQADFVKYAYAAVGTDVTNADALAKGFDGESNITYVQAEQVIFDAAGYTPLVEANGKGVHEYAKSSGLMYGVTYGSENEAVTTESAAVMLYNLINMKVVEPKGYGIAFGEDTIMESKLNVYDAKGIVNATNETGIAGYSKVSDNSVMIGDTEYNIGNTSAQALLGMNVRLYYKDDKRTGEYVIKWIEVDNSKTSTAVIYGCDVTSASASAIKYNAAGGSKKTAKLAQGADIIYNGVLSDSKTPEAVKSLTCEATLIDNNGAAGYDVIIIRDYSYYFVSSFSASELVVNDYYSNQTLDVDKDNYSVLRVTKDGAAASVSDIAAGQVIAAAVSEDGSVAYLELLTGSVTGEITSYNEDDAVIGGITYDISQAYVGDRIKNGRSGTFYFDRLGKVVRSSNVKVQASQYGYLTGYYSNTDGTSNFEARILTAEGSVKVFKVNDSVSFNESKRSAKEVYNLLGAANNCEQLITYSVNSNNEITKIKTADRKYVGVDEPNIDAFTLNYEGTGRYRKNNMCFNSKYLIDSTTPIFLIPYDGERDEYAVKNASYLTNNYTYTISVYDIDEYMYGSAIVLKENLIEPENLKNKRPLVITKMLRGVNEDDEDTLVAEGYQMGSKVTMTLANDKMYDNRGNIPVSNLRAGDVIQYGTNSKGEINVVQIMYRAEYKDLSIAGGTSNPNSYWEGGTVVFPDLWVSCGKVVNRNSELVMVDDDGDETKLSKSPHLLGSAVTYLYEDGKVNVSNKNEILVDDTVYVHEYQGKVQDVLIVR